MKWIETKIIRQGRILKQEIKCFDCEERCIKLIGLNEEYPKTCVKIEE